MRVPSRPLLIAGLVLVLVGCGSATPTGHKGSSAPGHGLLFTYAANPKSNSWCRCGDDIYLWAGSVLFQPHRLTNSPSDPKGDPQWSPDGREIAWDMVSPALCKQDAETCGGKFGCVDEVWVASSTGAVPRTVSPPYRDSSNNPGCSTAPSWSPNGKQLVFERISDTAPPNFAILTLGTKALRRLPVRAEGIGGAPAWGRPGIAYIHTTRIHHPVSGEVADQIRVVDPATGSLKFSIRLNWRKAGDNFGYLAWSSRGELAAVEGKRIVVYSSTGRKVADFGAPRSQEAVALTSPLVWSPDGKRLLVCVDPFGGLSVKAHQKLVNTAAKRSRYPAPVPYLVNPGGARWQRFELPNPKEKETVCSATSWR
ncbi:MAG TPA: hypothetical protein VKR79_09410 [Gaiellaceae bacterium]|nr:hypothetical protein [Gaiellaceae bacterium]